jgi:excinuclease ABC subunit C
MAFEEAEQINNRIKHLKEYLQKSTIINPKLGNLEVFGYYEEQTKAYVNYLSVSEGTIIKTKTFTIKKALDEPKEEILLKVIIDCLGNEFDQKNTIASIQIRK